MVGCQWSVGRGGSKMCIVHSKIFAQNAMNRKRLLHGRVFGCDAEVMWLIELSLHASGEFFSRCKSVVFCTSLGRRTSASAVWVPPAGVQKSGYWYAGVWEITFSVSDPRCVVVNKLQHIKHANCLKEFGNMTGAEKLPFRVDCDQRPINHHDNEQRRRQHYHEALEQRSLRRLSVIAYGAALSISSLIVHTWSVSLLAIAGV